MIDKPQPLFRKNQSTDRYVFTGTTLSMEDARAILGSKWEVMPPIRRGDIPRILANDSFRDSAGVIIVIDGLFFFTESVSLSEIRDAIDAGWRVVGVSSMGALRAVEAKPLGMQGFGAVFRWLSMFRVEDDDEIVQAVETTSYAPASDSMVDIRAFLSLVVKAGIVDRDSANAVAHELKLMFFPHRSIRLAVSLLAKHVPPDSKPSIAKMAHGFHGPKQRDAIRALLSLRASHGG